MPGMKIERKQHEAIAALLQHSRLDEAAAAVGVSPVTLWRWMQNPCFRAAYEEARREVVKRAIDRLQAASEGAVATLVELKDKAEKESVRLHAAKALLDLAFNVVTLQEIEERLARLEEAVANSGR